MTGYCQPSISEIKQFAGLSGPSLRGANKSCWWPRTFWWRLPHMAALRFAEFKSKGTAALNIPPRPAAVCYSHPGMPAHTLRCGFFSSHRNTARRGWMRGIGFTAQTTEPQSASCPAFLHSAILHAQLLLVCNVSACAVCLGKGGAAPITYSFLKGSIGWNVEIDMMVKAQKSKCLSSRTCSTGYVKH